MEVLRKFCAFFVKPLSFIIAKIIYRVKVEGMENVPKNEACIICGNHVHALDAPALVAVTRNGLAKGVKPKNGAVNIAIRAGVPIVPFAVIGTFKPFTKVIYRFDKPIDYSEYKEKGKDKDVVDGLTKELMDKIVELRDKKVNS